MKRVVPRLLLSLALLALTASLAWSAAPVIETVSIDTGLDMDAPGWQSYHERVVVIVSDADGYEDIACVQLQDPNGGWHGLPRCHSIYVGTSWWQVDANTIGVELYQSGLPDPPTSGSYTVEAYDWAWTSDTLTTASLPSVSGTCGTVVSPVMDSVISAPVPTFEWTNGSPADFVRLEVGREAAPDPIWSVDLAASATSAVYDFDGTADESALLPNHTYLWWAGSWVQHSDPNPKVLLYTANRVGGRFTAYGAWADTPPALPGKLSYGLCAQARNTDAAGEPPIWLRSATVAYNTDPVVRTWLGPDGSDYADWSADGSKVLYAKSGKIWIDTLDGSPPTAIPGITGGDCRWGPTANRITFQRWGPESPTCWPNYDVWVSNIDGSNALAVADSPDHNERWPVWSPDGLWVAYRKVPADGGSALWLVRYDGTEAHPFLAAGVVGYPGYEVNSIFDPAWSPDGLRLAVVFDASLPGSTDPADSVGGIGVVSREGGLITPVFLAGPEPICCGRALNPHWSPDGTKVVFSSGHHVPDPVDPGIFDPRVELWMVNSDGTGGLTRLTYDNSYSFYPSWWAPNTEPETPGDPVTIVAGDTTVSFESVESGGTTTAVTFDDPPGETPGGFEFLGDYYDITTNATLAPDSKITIQIHADDADVPGGQEEWLSLMHWEVDRWVDITVRPVNTVDNIITGECTSLSAFGIAFGPQFVGLLPPINNDGSSIFKLKRTIPVKFQLKNADGSFMTDAVAKLYLAKVSNNVVGSYEEPTSTSAADSGNTFRYVDEADQYIFNLGTKGLSTGTWVLQVTVNGMVAKEVWISLK